jgi:GNAT superfamily N-acetyltransferase
MSRFSNHTRRARRAPVTPRHHWRIELAELAAVFAAMATADFLTDMVGEGPHGVVLLGTAAAAMTAAAFFHGWWARRHSHAPPVPSATPAAATGPGAAATGVSGPRDAVLTPREAGSASGTGARPAAPGTGDGADRTGGHGDAEEAEDAEIRVPVETSVWRLRTTVRDAPGSLAALCGALAAAGIDILTLQTHPLADGTADEFLLRAPATLAPGALLDSVARGGGRDSWLERADAHDLVDVPTRMLTLAARTAVDAAELPLALRQLFGRCTVRSTPPARAGARGARDSYGSHGDAMPTETEPEADVLDGTVMRLREPSGGTLVVERPALPFTPTEFARARALVELDARLGARLPEDRDVRTLAEGNEITIRRAGPEDLAAARDLHGRCSRDTLTARYHGPVADVDRYLEHLLSPRFGRSLVVESPSGRIVALGHLLWDGDENEVALLVEDAWQGRGIGSALLRELVGLAEEAGRESVYAVTKATNATMVATMRSLGLPLDHQVENGTLVITATLDPRHASTPAR